MIDVNVISTGSQGNAVLLNHDILIDCGVSFTALKPYARDLKLVLLTHIHSDHFRRSTLKKLHQERPALRFGCGRWLVKPLVDLGIRPGQIDVLDDGGRYKYPSLTVEPVPLVHDVPNYGYKLHFVEQEFICNMNCFHFLHVLYATDTVNLNGVSAKDYDLYLLEANYQEDEIETRIRRKKEAGEYAYERRVLKTHLSKAACDDFIARNAGQNSQFIYLHEHREDDRNVEQSNSDGTPDP